MVAARRHVVSNSLITKNNSNVGFMKQDSSKTFPLHKHLQHPLPLHHKSNNTKNDDEDKYKYSRKRNFSALTESKFPSIVTFVSVCIAFVLFSALLSYLSVRTKKKQWRRSKLIADKFGWGMIHNKPLPIVVEIRSPISEGSTRLFGASYDEVSRKQNNLSIKGFQVFKNIKRVKDIDAEVNIPNIKSSRDYEKSRNEDFIIGDCVQQYKWQIESYPSCNSMHEVSMAYNNDTVALINGGFWRNIWEVHDFDGSPRIVKTLRYDHDWTDRNFDRHRRDALATARLTSSPFVMDIYSFCGNSGIFEHTGEGSLDNIIWSKKGKDLQPIQKLKIAIDAASGLADVHNIDREGLASIAHTDIAPGQFLLVNGIYKLNDFNRARFMRWNTKTNSTCGYKVGNNPGSFRSPEEYNYEVQDEKVDIYSLGNVFYCLLTRLWPFDNMRQRDVIKAVRAGKRPPMKDDILISTDPAIVALRTAMELALSQNPNDRPSARELVSMLTSTFDKILSTNITSSDVASSL